MATSDKVANKDRKQIHKTRGVLELNNIDAILARQKITDEKVDKMSTILEMLIPKPKSLKAVNQ